MKSIICTLVVLLLLGCTEDDQESLQTLPASPEEHPPGEFPAFDSSFFPALGKPVATVSYFLPDTINIAHRIVHQYNQAGDIVQEARYHGKEEYYITLRYWYEGGNLMYKKYKEEPWYTKLVYNTQNQLQQRIGLDSRSGTMDTLFVHNYHYYHEGETVVITNLPEPPYHFVHEGSYFYDSLRYREGRLIEEYRTYGNSIDSAFYLQAKREYMYNNQGQLVKVWLTDGISNVWEGNNLFNSGVIETYRYRGDRLMEMRIYDAYKGYGLTNILQYKYAD